ncbi:MAG: hypothetical protein RR320_01215, partial [Oscillospiraceae bacterium]
MANSTRSLGRSQERADSSDSSRRLSPARAGRSRSGLEIAAGGADFGAGAGVGGSGLAGGAGGAGTGTGTGAGAGGSGLAGGAGGA